MNTYHKFAPNCRGVKTLEQYEKGEYVSVTNKYGQDRVHIIWKLVFTGKDGNNHYSMIYDGDSYSERKANKYINASIISEGKSNNYYNKSQKGSDFLSLAEPIKVGHHSEARHRALIAHNNKAMGNSVEQSKKAEDQRSKGEYRSDKATTTNLSTPNSIEYYKNIFEKKTEDHKKMKAGEIPKQHSYSLIYLNKEKKEAEKNYELAKKIWGI